MIKRLIILILLVLFLVPSLAEAARYKIIDSRGNSSFFFVGNQYELKIVMENDQRVSNSGVVVIMSRNPVVWFMIPDKNDVVFLKVIFDNQNGPYKIYTKGNSLWGKLVKVQ